MRYCPICFAPTANDPCHICGDPLRDHSTVCVVETFGDLLAIEDTGTYHGTYHVLHGTINPMEGIGPDQLRVRELLARVRGDETGAVFLAMKPNTNGDATAMYLYRILKPLGVQTERRRYYA